MRRLGMTYRKDTVYKDVHAVWFEIDAATWAAQEASTR